MIMVTKLLDEYRLAVGQQYVGSEYADNDARLVMAEEVIEQLPSRQQPERDSMGFVFPTHAAATLALAQVVNRLWKGSP